MVRRSLWAAKERVLRGILHERLTVLSLIFHFAPSGTCNSFNWNLTILQGQGCLVVSGPFLRLSLSAKLQMAQVPFLFLFDVVRANGADGETLCDSFTKRRAFLVCTMRTADVW